MSLTKVNPQLISNGSLAIDTSALASSFGYDHLSFTAGDVVTVATGQTFTIDIPFTGDLSEHFAGNGNVVFLDGTVSEIYPEWWGAVADGTTDCVAAVEAAIASVNGVPIKFQEGTYKFASTLDAAKSKVWLTGCGRPTILNFTGSGNCVSFDGGVGGVNSPRIENFLINGNAAATNAIYTDNCTYGICKNVVVLNVSGAGFRSLYGVYWHIEDFSMGNNFGTQTTIPAVGIYLGGATGLQTVTAYTIINANIANCSASGIDMNNGWQNNIIGGAVEANGDQGLYLGVNSHDNVINGLYVEANGTNNIVMNGNGDQLIGLWCIDNLNTPIEIGSGTSDNRVIGGVYGDINILAGATRNQIISARLAGTWTDNGTGTVVNSVHSFGTPAGFIHPTFVTSWTNNATYPYETFTSSGADITSAINTTGFGIGNSNILKLQGGATYLFQWNLTLNSGTAPGFVINTSDSAAATAVSVAGNNVYMFTPATDGDYYFTFRNETGVASNFACSQINVKQIN